MLSIRNYPLTDRGGQGLCPGEEEGWILDSRDEYQKNYKVISVIILFKAMISSLLSIFHKMIMFNYVFLEFLEGNFPVLC